jgi:hypothetical protein
MEGMGIAVFTLFSKQKAGESIINVSSACGVKKALKSLKNILKKEGFTVQPPNYDPRLS